MILRERVVVVKSGGTDSNGDPLPTTDVGPIPAAVHPLATEEKNMLGTSVSTSLLCILGPVLPSQLAAKGITSNEKVKYDGITWDVTGDAEKHRVNGRTHHLELTLTSDRGRSG